MIAHSQVGAAAALNVEVDDRSKLNLSERIEDERINFCMQVKDVFMLKLALSGEKIVSEASKSTDHDLIPDSIDFSEFWMLAQVFASLSSLSPLYRANLSLLLLFPIIFNLPTVSIGSTRYDLQSINTDCK